MESILITQQELHGRTYKNLKKAGSTKIIAGLIATTLQLFENGRNSRSSTKNFVTERILISTTITYRIFWAKQKRFSQRAALLDLEESLKVREERKPLIAEISPSPHTTLPRIQLPQFSGKFEN